MFEAMPPSRRRVGWLLPAIAVVVAAALVVTYFVTRGSGTSPSASPTAAPSGSSATTTTAPAIPNVTAPIDGEVFNKTTLAEFNIALEGPAATGASITLDGAPVQGTTSAAGLIWKPTTLADGKHTVVIAGTGIPGGSVTRTFTVDTTPPKLTIPTPKPVAAGAALTLTGTSDPNQAIKAGDVTATAGADGAFTLSFPKAPPAVTVQATDAAGNVATTDVTVAFDMPHTKAVHMTALAWAYKPKRDAVLQLIKDKQITAVELDIKDEDGYVGYDSQVPLAKETGASKGFYDARKAIDQLHALNVRVIGRLVCFRDPTLAKWAWFHGHQDAVIQKSTGGPFYGTYGNPNKPWAFTNFANKLVRDYNNAIAIEAAKLGFDDILFDYVRRPDGAISKMRIPGMSANPSADVAEFVHQTRQALAAANVQAYLGVSVFGIAATRPQEIAQNIPMLGKYVDYVSPMVYPSHWAPGEYNVKNPNKQPYDIVLRSLVDFQKDLKGTSATVVPWLQDFSLGVTYTAKDVQAQIKAAKDDGIDSFLLWNADANYTAAALGKN